MTEKIKIVQVTEITEELVTAFNVLIPQLSPNSLVPTKNDLGEIINSKNTVLFVAKDKEIVGTLTMVINKTPTGNKVWIEDVVVDQKMRGKGLGGKLIQFAIDFAIKKGIKKIDLTSGVQRIAAHELYKKLGFKKRETNVYRLVK